MCEISLISSFLYSEIIYLHLTNQLMTSNAQFAFKKCHSTSLCTALVKEVVSYYNGRKTNVYACLLDATKAFDCVIYDKLFELLLKKDIPGTVIRLLLDSYTRQYAYITMEQLYVYPHKNGKWGQVGRRIIAYTILFVYTLMNCCEDYGKLMWAVM